MLYEKSRLPRHKVCGEFLSPAVAPLLRELGAWNDFVKCGPAIIERFTLTFGARCVSAELEEPAYGLSRYALDHLLLQHAIQSGARLVRASLADAPEPVVIAHGRMATVPASVRGRRLFGFKTHFRGPSNNAIELYFSRGAYVGVSGIEHGRTNVCGLASEQVLTPFGFDFDQLVHSQVPLQDRLAQHSREMAWLATGPLVFRSDMNRAQPDQTYKAGDALLFVDPFTGSGMLNAIKTGALAGRCAAMGVSSAEYLKACRAELAKPFRVAALFRMIVQLGWAERLAGLAPPALLFRMTRVA